MIVIKDWIASVPEEEKHLAYMGEHQAVTRSFLLTGGDWADYADWGFYLDMGFDLSSVTTRELRQTETTSSDVTEDVTEVQVHTTSTGRKETFTVEDVTVDCWSETDVASLGKQVTEEGIVLSWRVLRQHVLLPGALRATLRALSPDGGVKKSSLMVFDVDPAVEATPAAELPESEFEEMERRMSAIAEEVLETSLLADGHAVNAAAASARAQEAAQQAIDAKNAIQPDVEALELRVASLASGFQNLAAVQYTSQTLTDAQKAQARSNLGLVVDDEMSHESANPVQNKVVYGVMAQMAQNVTARVELLEQKQVTVDRDLSIVSTNPVQNQAVTSYFSKIDTQLGSIDTALDHILSIQESLIGGDGV